jgi:hypothetical protein
MDPINTVLCGSSQIAKGIDFGPLISHRHVRRQSRVVSVDEDESYETPGRSEKFLRWLMALKMVPYMKRRIELQLL